MADRTITLTVAEAEHLVTLPTDGTLWLVRDDPAEFVAATAPCPTCSGWTRFAGDGKICPTCKGDRRIELVGPCPTCAGSGIEWNDTGVVGIPPEPLGCQDCEGEGTITTHGYADSRLLPIMPWASSVDPPSGSWLTVTYGGVLCEQAGDSHHLSIRPLADLTHYGDPQSLVGKWALQVRVVS